MTDLSAILQHAKEAAHVAGPLIRKAWAAGSRSAIEATKVSAVDLVTETDQQCEAAILATLKANYPDAEYIGEETVGSGKYALTDKPTWIIDPIDGTTNFVHRIPLCAVLVSYAEKGQVLVGVIYDPIGNETFYASKGGGAFLDSVTCGGDKIPIRTSGTSELAQSVINFEVGYRRGPEYANWLGNRFGSLVVNKVRGVRAMGAAGPALAYVACGRLDATFEQGSWEMNCGPKIWDFSGASLVVQEAGGSCIDAKSGGSFDVMGRSFFAASSKVLADSLWTALNESNPPELIELGGPDGSASKSKDVRVAKSPAK
mmetsp:Transcript_23120/g.50962  ORF Transcript_23120/g.50962 Transcript_23120/m.50962 type:complete len:315 (+) Transcript_23120:34-978(+)